MNVILTPHLSIFQPVEPGAGGKDESGGKSPRLTGASISGRRQMEALARADFVDRLIAYAPPGMCSRVAKTVEESRFADRVEVLDEVAIGSSLGSEAPVLIVNFGPDLLRPQALRWASGNHRWPICGFTYSIAASWPFQALVLAAASGFQPYDSIFCCSTSTHASMERLLDIIGGHVPGAVRPRLPVVPLGIRVQEFRATARVDARRALSLPAEAVVFLYLGRIDPRYKADLQPLISAFSRLDRPKNAHLVLAGAGPHSDGSDSLGSLRLRARELGVADRVVWHADVTPETRRNLLSAADVFVSPVDSLQESFGLAVVEAMCSGLPVIASDWNGYRDIVVHGQTGLLVPTRLPADISALSRHAGLANDYDFHWEVAQATVVDLPALERDMARLARDPDLRAEMGRKGLERAKSCFDWSVVLQRSREEWGAQLEMARSVVTPPSAPLVIDHGTVFADHPSERLDDLTLLRRTPEAVLPSVVVSLPPPFLSASTLQEIVEATGEAVALGQLPGDPATTARHTAYLLKHGMLEIVD